MSEEANTRLGEDQEAPSSGLLLSVESMQGGESERRSSQRVDNADTDTDKQDTGDILIDSDGTDTSGDSDATDASGDSDGTDTVGDSDGTDSGDSDGNDS